MARSPWLYEQRRQYIADLLAYAEIVAVSDEAGKPGQDDAGYGDVNPSERRRAEHSADLGLSPPSWQEP